MIAFDIDKMSNKMAVESVRRFFSAMSQRKGDSTIMARGRTRWPVYADYDGDIGHGPDDLAEKLKTLSATAYAYLITVGGIDRLKDFLPYAQRAGIQVWAYFDQQPGVSDSPDSCRKLAEELQGLATEHRALTALAMDDFSSGGYKLWTPELLRDMRERAPSLEFYATGYFPDFIKTLSEFDYQGVLDGVIFAYKDLETVDALDHERPVTEDNEVEGWPRHISMTDQLRLVSGLVKPEFDVLRMHMPVNTEGSVGMTRRAKVLTPEAAQLGWHYVAYERSDAGDRLIFVLLINGKTVFATDVTQDTVNDRAGIIDTSQEKVLDDRLKEAIQEEAIQGKGTVDIEFRLYRERDNNVGVTLYVYGITTKGLELDAEGWKQIVKGGGAADVKVRNYPWKCVSMVYTGTTGWHKKKATPSYIEAALKVAHDCVARGEADGVMTYCLPKDPDNNLFQLVRGLYGQWRA
jgi:hypothetical protein